MTDQAGQASVTETPVKPDDHITIQFGVGEERKPRTLYMSWMRQNSIHRFLPSPTEVIYLLADPDSSEAVLKIMLAEKGGPGEMREVELDEMSMSNEDVERVLIWVQGHMQHFFMTRFQRLAETAGALEPMVKALQSSTRGSEVSTGQPASAGPSE